VKYYDLNRNPIACPKCGTAFNPDALLRSRRSRPAAPVKAAAAAVASQAPEVDAEADGDEEDLKVAALDGDDKLKELAEDDDEDDELIEDTSELAEDDVGVEVTIGDDDDDT
jgi:hypothetical protein